GLEPAAVLVRAFEIEVGRHTMPFPVLQHGGVGYARVEPDVENVSDLLVLVRLVAQQLLGIELAPGIDTLLLHAQSDLLYQLQRARVGLAGALIHEPRDGHAPEALAGNAPVGAVAHHALDSGLAPRGVPGYALNCIQRLFAQAGLVEVDEPLRGGAEDDGRLVPPAVWVAVLVLLVLEQRAALGEHAHDLVVGLEDRLAFEQF